MRPSILSHTKKTIEHLLMFVLLSSISVRVFGQEEIKFQAFGYTPNHVNDSLYIALKNVKTAEGKLKLLYQIGQEHITYGNADSVIHYGNLIREIPLEKESDTLVYLARAKQLLGEGKYMQGLYDEALKEFIEGMEAAKKTENSLEKCALKLGLGKVYLQKNAYGKAKSLFLECAEQTVDSVLAAKANLFLGVTALKEKQSEVAEQYLVKAATPLPLEIPPKLVLEIDFYKGILACERKKYKEALPLFEKVINNSLQQNYYDLYTEAILQYGSVSIAQGEFDVAEMTLSMAYANALQWNRLELQKKIINSLRRLYAQKGDYKNAYNLMTQYLGVSNEINQKQNSKAIQELEYKYQTLQKENQIFELKEEQLSKQNEIDRQKTIKKAFLYGFLAVLIPIIALLFVYYQKLQTQSQLNLQQKEISTQKIASVLKEQELKLAKTTLNAQQEERYRIAQQLHDSIGGNLAGIKLQMANSSDGNKIQKGILEQIDETYELVRDISHNLVPEKFNQSAFSSLISEYVDKLKNGSDLEVTFLAHPKEQIDNLPDKLKVEIYQIVQELFANMIKHAKAKSAELHLTIYEATIQLLFEDDGVGFKMESTKKGLGLNHMKNRLHKLNGKITLDSALGRGTAVTIEIPLNEKNETI